MSKAVEDGLFPPLPEWMRDKRYPRPWDAVSEAFLTLIGSVEGEGVQREGLADTPKRAARAWEEMMSGYGPMPELKWFTAETHGLVAMEAIPFFSHCEHHALPFFGTAHFAYIPGERMLGFSKFARLTKHISRRLQCQERLTRELCDTLNETLEPQGVMVITRASHLCMMMRGAQSLGQSAIVSEVRGAFQENAETRAEAMRLLS